MTGDRRLSILHLALWLAAALATSVPAQVLPNDAVVEGRTIGDWSAQWWRWVLSIPVSQNPMLDTNGAFAAMGQPEGNVHFVAGALGLAPGPITRRFTVPEGKYLFLPLLMYEADNVDTFPPLSVEELREQATGVMNDVLELHANLDGNDVPNLYDHRAISPVFSLVYTNADNLHSFAFGHPVTGLIDPMICEGYWLMIEPLPPGPHVLRFGGAFRRPLFFPSDITAHITVVPVPLEQKVEVLRARLEEMGIPAPGKRALEVLLLRAGTAFGEGHLRAGLNHLRAFQTLVRARFARSETGLAADLIRQAQAVMDRAEQDLVSGSRSGDDRPSDPAYGG